MQPHSDTELDYLIMETACVWDDGGQHPHIVSKIYFNYKKKNYMLAQISLVIII
jgi:hypothetical protein